MKKNVILLLNINLHFHDHEVLKLTAIFFYGVFSIRYILYFIFIYYHTCTKTQQMISNVFISTHIFTQCINNAARSLGIKRSLDLPDKTLQFIRDRPLMDDAVRPITGKPLLVNRGPSLTRLVVDHVTALDGQSYPVMFIGTGEMLLSASRAKQLLTVSWRVCV